MMGLLRLSSVDHRAGVCFIRCISQRIFSRRSRALSASSGVLGADGVMSYPALNALPFARSVSTRTSGSSSARSAHSISSSWSCWLSAFSFSGRSSLMRPTPSEDSYSMKS